MILGVPIVARELESGTAAMTWGLAVRRIRWLLRRCWPVAALLVVLLGVIGLIGDFVMTAWETPLDPGFLLYDHRGLLLSVRGLAVLGLALTIGAVLGRTIPALLVASLIAAGLAVGIGFAIDGLRRSDAVVLNGSELGEQHERYFGSLVLPNVWIIGDGSFTDDPNRAPEGSASAFWLVPPTTLWKWLSIEAAVTLMATAVVAGIGVVVTDRRKPR